MDWPRSRGSSLSGCNQRPGLRRDSKAHNGAKTAGVTAAEQLAIRCIADRQPLADPRPGGQPGPAAPCPRRIGRGEPQAPKREKRMTPEARTTRAQDNQGRQSAEPSMRRRGASLPARSSGTDFAPERGCHDSLNCPDCGGGDAHARALETARRRPARDRCSVPHTPR